MGSVSHATPGCEAAAHDPRAPLAVEPHPHALGRLHGPPARRPPRHRRAPGRRPHARGARRRRRRGQGGGGGGGLGGPPPPPGPGPPPPPPPGGAPRPPPPPHTHTWGRRGG